MIERQLNKENGKWDNIEKKKLTKSIDFQI